MASQTFDFLLVMDFEATCTDDGTPMKNEIIEFPCVLVDTKNRTVVGEFHRYVRPTESPVLKPFCTELTGIQQAQVDPASTIEVVLAEFIQWVSENPLLKQQDRFSIVTCGDWDLNIALRTESSRKGFTGMVPNWMQRWVNVKKVFQASRGNDRGAGMARMLTELDMELIGKHHSGIDDSRNIARICCKLLEQQVSFETTATWPTGRSARKSRVEAQKQEKKERKEASKKGAATAVAEVTASQETVGEEEA
mmetsp:Transcript_66247/g.138064  ORF Transcript_66247/g.138064 Transcript_66247/m.138064 type:complete len:251 (-) Transcript_66247:66-818(-)|eukprot:CAMPEP_0181310826 /NCGR_PEP_ID=MMETSP1101-20121128/12797_1 /TAXON_ID=46948 /ORGANISM="Rhodomonas abbreviata, Strain Caron Lab Isolate" /LENGTH=250 /DNA_ID=CAMNT_0023417489 /DNA_START=91 /DNA_END=843 /DNA_ORIENTATION=-